MKSENSNFLKRLIYMVLLFFIICAGSICVDNEPVQARYSSPKQVKKDIRKLNKKIKKLKAKSKKAYAKWMNISSGRSIGTGKFELALGEEATEGAEKLEEGEEAGFGLMM